MPTSTKRLEHSLQFLNALGDEAPRIFIQLYADAAQEAAHAADQRAARGLSLGPLDGKLVSVKDLLDVAGQVTTAGAAMRKSWPCWRPPCLTDAGVRFQMINLNGALRN